jgi:WD40 repeat protein
MQTQYIDITKSCIRDLKFSPNGYWLAVGAEPNVFELYTTQDYKRRANLKKHTGPVSHVDWSCDSHFLQATSDSQELLFFSAQDSQHLTELKQNIRNESWNTQNCVYGWSLQGVYKDSLKEGTEVNAADRSNNRFYREYQAIATGDDLGEVKVFKFPCVQATASPVVGRGHASFVSNVKWTADDRYIISVGGEDQTVIVWEIEKLS